MGYSSRLSGDLEITLPERKELPAEFVAQARALGVAVPTDDFDGPVTPRATVAAIEAVDNFSHFYQFEAGDGEGDVLTPTGEGGKAYTFEEDLREVLDILRKSNLLVNGTVLVVGEDGSEASRYIVKDTVLTVERAEVVLRWPDGTVQTLPRR